MEGFTETTKEAFEVYNQGNLKQALSMLTPGSQHHYYIKIMEELKTARNKLSKDAMKLIEDYKKNFSYQLGDEISQAIIDRLIRMEEYDYVKTLAGNNIGVNFNHQKPYYAQNTGNKREENLGPNFWRQEDHFSGEALIAKVYSDPYTFSSLHKSLHNSLDYTKFSTTNFESVIGNLTTFADIVTDSFMKAFCNLIKERFNDPHNGRYYTIPDGYLKKLTLEQMDTLKKKESRAGIDSAFLGNYFSKVYHYYFQDPEFYQCASLEEKRDLFVKILSEYKSGQGLRTCLIRAILEYGIKLDIYDKDLFLEYLKYPISSGYLKYEGPYNTQGDNWSYHYTNLRLNGYGYDEHKLYTSILSHFHSQPGQWKDFEKFFDPNWLKNYKLECEFLSGKELNETELAHLPFDLQKKVMIELSETNRESFKPDERVKLIVDIKNVTSLYIKVFEFNTLNYFKKTKEPFRTDVNLDGLIATKEFIYEYTEAPQKKHRQVFEFEHLDNQVGVFIIELIANGYSSRATIKKGTLSLVHKPTIAGQLAYIVNEDHQICCSEDTGIWLDQQFYKADTEKGGRILIPYEKYTKSYQAILVHEGFAHLESFYRLAEQYSFDTTFVLHPESLVMGNEATLLIRPKLQLNSRTCDMKLLENCTAVLTTMTYVDNIPVTKTYDNLVADENNDIPVEFQVPPNLQYVQVTFTCDVRNVTMGTTEKMSRSKRYDISTNTDNAKYYEAFMRRVRLSKAGKF